MAEKEEIKKSSLRNKTIVVFFLTSLLINCGAFFNTRLLIQALSRKEIDPVIAGKIVKEFTLISSGLAMAGFFLVLLIAFFAAKYLTIPIKRLTEICNEIAKGRLDLQVDPKLRESDDEIGELAIAFNEMTVKLKESQARIIRSEKLAALGKLAGMVGHELRNPLAAIRNSAYFLKMRLGGALEDEKIKRHLDILEEEVDASDQIITDILTFSRVKELNLSRIDLGEVIKWAIQRINMPGNIQVIMEAGQARVEALADEIQIRQVFFNIILNAVQAMPAGGKLAIEMRITDERGSGFADIRIKDTGEGIQPENLRKIFEPLFSTKAKGIGLGLLVCQGIIERHNGLISVESQPGKGTSFIIRLPV